MAVGGDSFELMELIGLMGKGALESRLITLGLVIDQSVAYSYHLERIGHRGNRPL